MPLELMPDGVTFKKLNATQEKALKRYYKRQHDKPSSQYLSLPTSLTVLGGIGAIAYIFKEEIQKAFEEQKIDFFTWMKDLPVAAGGGVADIIIKAEEALFPQNPVTPEFIIIDGREIGPLSRCKRWEVDANDWHRLAYDSGELTRTEKTLAALTAARIIKNMKKEGCDRPPSFTQSQWDDI